MGNLKARFKALSRAVVGVDAYAVRVTRGRMPAARNFSTSSRSIKILDLIPAGLQLATTPFVARALHVHGDPPYSFEISSNVRNRLVAALIHPLRVNTCIGLLKSIIAKECLCF
jgi:hypothetical protein